MATKTKEEVLDFMPHYSEAQAEKHAAAHNAAEAYRAIFAGTTVETQVGTILANLVTMAVATASAKQP